MEHILIKIFELLKHNKILSFFSILGISIIQIIIASVFIKIINFAIKKSFKSNSKLTQRKKETLIEVFKSLSKYLVYFVVICSILANFGINIASIMTIAGVGSVAIGFGAQSLVQDIITGMFILFEDQYGVGDIIEVNGLNGCVESINIRTTNIRSVDGNLHIIPNGQIKIVTNMSKEFNRAVIDFSVSYEEDIDNVIFVIDNELKRIFENNLIDGLLLKPVVLGVVELAPSSVNIRISADTKVGENWAVERSIRKFIKNRLDKENINIPYPKQVIQIEEMRKV